MLEIMRQHLSEVSLFMFFGYSPNTLVLILILGVNLVLTLVHSVQELYGRQWRYLGDIAGVRIPDVWGFSIFFVLLTVSLLGLGIVGIGGYVPFSRYLGRELMWVTVATVGTLIGGRFSDWRNIHTRLKREGYLDNPGLTSAPYYLAEGIILTVLFLPGFWYYPVATASGFVVGWMVFVGVLPILRWLRKVFPSWRCKPWKAGEPRPDCNNGGHPPLGPAEDFVPNVN